MGEWGEIVAEGWVGDREVDVAAERVLPGEFGRVVDLVYEEVTALGPYCPYSQRSIFCRSLGRKRKCIDLITSRLTPDGRKEERHRQSSRFHVWLQKIP